jgi:hypothetical protein
MSNHPVQVMDQLELTVRFLKESKQILQYKKKEAE